MSLVEVIVAATVLIVVALATVAAFGSAGAAAGAAEARATALDVGQQEQQRLRGRSLTGSVGVLPSRTEVVDGDGYRVDTTLSWTVDGDGVDACSTTGGISRRIQMVTTVTSNLVGSTRQRAPAPVVIRSTVAPSGAALQATGATLVVKVAGATETTPVAGLPVTATPSGGGAATTVSTNNAGCAIITGLAAGSYAVSATRSGWVDMANNPSATVAATVARGQTLAPEPLRYAQAGSLDVRYGASDGAVRRSGQGNGATYVAPNSTTRSVGPLDATSGTTLTGLFPHPTAYAVRPSPCPSSSGPTTGGIVSPGGTTTVEPTLGHARVTRANGGSDPWEVGTEVVLRSADAACALRLDYVVAAGGVLQRRALQDRGIPFGSWRVCVRARPDGEPNRQYAPAVTVAVSSVSLTSPTQVTVPQPRRPRDHTSGDECVL